MAHAAAPAHAKAAATFCDAGKNLKLNGSIADAIVALRSAPRDPVSKIAAMHATN